MSTHTLRGVIVASLVAIVVLLGIPSLVGPIGHLVFGVPLVLVFPGYVVFRLLFPTTADGSSGDRSETAFLGAGSARPVVVLGVSVGFSVVLVPIIARVLVLMGSFSRPNLVLTIGGFVLLGALLASRRDPGTAGATPAPIASLVRTRLRATRSYFERDTLVGTVTGVLVVASVVFFLSSVAFAFTAPPSNEAYTEFYLLTEDESGDLVASDYPTELSRDEPTQLVTGVENHEGEPMTYTIVAEIQRIGNGTVLETQELDRVQVRVEPNESELTAHDVTTPLVGDRLRLQYYLYAGDPPAVASVEGADETLHLNVSSSPR